VEELFQHLRGHFDKVAFGGDAAHTRPRLLAAENGMHQVAELVEEGDHVAVLHQARIVRLCRRESCRSALPREADGLDPWNQRRCTEPLVFAFAGMHIQVETATQPAPVVDVPGAYLGMPDGGLLVELEADMEEPGCGFEYALLHRA
jgi:hypothetical protein